MQVGKNARSVMSDLDYLTASDQDSGDCSSDSDRPMRTGLSTHMFQQTIPVSPSFVKPVAVAKWNLHYTGDNRNTGVFLFTICVAPTLKINLHYTGDNRNTGSILDLFPEKALIQVRVIDAVTHTLILGADFWKIHGIVPDLRRGEWTFSKDTPIALLIGEQQQQLKTLIDTSFPMRKEGEIGEQQQQLKTLIDTSFPMRKEGEIGCTNLVEHVIESTAAPIKQRYYPISPALQKIVDKELDEMLRLGVVQKSTSPWSSPVGHHPL
ncbi:hypothetical protein QE152_g22299 [Popillia japonica]|uniref:Polyprotein n=1 Tax=Popillia japonica TaxID=7064 RepID=A0AAW1KMH8_POPJA